VLHRRTSRRFERPVIASTIQIEASLVWRASVSHAITIRKSAIEPFEKTIVAH